MKLLTVSIATLAVLYQFGAAGCSPSTQKERGVRSTQAESFSSPPANSVDPWKTAADWPAPAGPVGDAQRFLLNVPAYQFVTEWEELSTHQKAREEGRVVRNEALSIESAGPKGKEGLVTDGKREAMLYQGRYVPASGDAAGALDEQLENASLRSLLKVSEDHTPLLDAVEVDGIKAELYALTFRLEKGRTLPPPAWSQGNRHIWVWVAKEDHRPLRVEIKESDADPKKPGVIRNTVQVRTYRYDPNVRVLLPSS